MLEHFVFCVQFQSQNFDKEVDPLFRPTCVELFSVEEIVDNLVSVVDQVKRIQRYPDQVIPAQ